MDSIKAEKEIAIRRFRRLRQIGLILRFTEAAAAVILLSYSSTRIPAAARNSGEFFRRAAEFLISPRFVFILGNAIVLVLLRSGHLSESTTAGTGFGNICSEKSFSQQPILGTAQAEQKKPCGKNRACQRSRSKNFERRPEEAKLRREKTECFPKGGEARATVALDREEVAAQHSVGAVAEVDAEEFRRTIEEFIAKQQRFQREELLAVVVGSDGPYDPVSL